MHHKLEAYVGYGFRVIAERVIEVYDSCDTFHKFYREFKRVGIQMFDNVTNEIYDTIADFQLPSKHSSATGEDDKGKSMDKETLRKS